MAYGEPRLDHLEDFMELDNYKKWREKTKNLKFEEKVSLLIKKYKPQAVHGYFDAISPQINKLISFEEISRWFNKAGFKNIKKTLANRNHYIIAEKQ